MTNKDVKLTDGIRNEAVFNQVFSNDEIAKTFFEKFLKLKFLDFKLVNQKNEPGELATLVFPGVRFEATLDDKKKSKAAFGICLTCEKEKTIAMRLRYMDELICLGAVNKSCDPSDFPLNYLVAVSPNALYGGERRLYSFIFRDKYEPEITYDDGLYQFYLSAKGKNVEQDLNPEVEAFLDYINGDINPKSEFVKQVDLAVANLSKS